MKKASTPDKSIFISRKFRLLTAALSFAGGIGYAMALPPLNFNFLAFVILLPLLFSALFMKWYWRLFCGWLWGIGWALFAYSFLREIHPAVPWLLAPVLALWPGLYTMLLGTAAGFIFKGQKPLTLRNFEYPWYRVLFYGFVAAALFTVLEWTRCQLFVWNDLSVTLWQLPVLMQIARLTGRYGASFLITSVNAAIFVLIFFRKRFIPAGILLIFPVFALVYGIFRFNAPEEFRDAVTWECILIQGDLPQQRHGGSEEIRRAIDTYCSMSRQAAAGEKAQTVIWPECAVPIPLRSTHPLGNIYRQEVAKLLRDSGTQLLIGTLDFDGNGDMTNSAVLIAPSGRIAGKYDKFHRVPFGEYVPGREFLPESWIKAFDMGRDLTAGKLLNPLPVSDEIRAGTVVCYEGVFSYVSAGFVRQGANVLAAISNDVWYPESSEPEQHLANAVMRCVETGLPMVRCGNNGGSGVVSSKGVFHSYIGTPAERPELLREKAAGKIQVTFEKNPEITPAVRFENLLIWLLLTTALLVFAGDVLYRRFHRKNAVRQ